MNTAGQGLATQVLLTQLAATGIVR
jgi:hypothetical protein